MENLSEQCCLEIWQTALHLSGHSGRPSALSITRLRCSLFPESRLEDHLKAILNCGEDEIFDLGEFDRGVGRQILRSVDVKEIKSLNYLILFII